MVRLCVVLTLCVSACYHPTYKDCAIACTTDCPGELQCDGQLHMCRLPGKTGACDVGGGDAATDATDPTGDADSDGILNASDNCPTTANPMQENEDSDALGDACDPCPISPSMVDTDADGLPDACDPNPMSFGGHVITDRIVFFDGFTNGPGLSEIRRGTGTVSSLAGATHIVAQSGHIELLLLPTVPTGMGGDTVTTDFTYATAPGAQAGAGPITLVKPSSSDGVACLLFNVGANGSELDIEETANSSFDGSTPVNDPPTPGVHRLRIQRIVNADITMPTIICGDGSTSVAAAELATASFDMGLFVHDTDATFNFVMVVASGT
jgi:hypothetical protein